MLEINFMAVLVAVVANFILGFPLVHAHFWKSLGKRNGP